MRKMPRKVSIRLTEQEYEKLMSVEGKTKTDKIRKLLKQGESNYFTEHMKVDDADFKQYAIQKQVLMAIGVLLRKIYGDDTPEKIIKDYIPKFNKGDILPLYRRLYNDINEFDECDKYENLTTFISIGLLKYKESEVDDPGYYRVIGETLAEKFYL